MFNQLSAVLNTLYNSALHNLSLVLTLVAVLWAIQLVNAIVGYRLNRWGMVPRTRRGLWGIVSFHLLHSSWGHLFFNTFPFFVLSILILVYGTRVFMTVTLIVMFVSGVLVWLMGRRAIHVGVSALIMGYWGFLLLNAYQNVTVASLVLAVICLIYFAGLVWCLAPSERSSWEGHLCGLFGGFVASHAMTVWIT